MTTPTQLREAADRLLRCVNDPNPEHVYFEPSDIELCAEYLRALASAQSDAEKGWFAWATKQGYDMDKTRTGDWCDNETSESQISYLAGHVQGIAAGLAASSAKCAELEERCELLSQDNWQLKRMNEPTVLKLATAKDERDTAKARVVELEQHLQQIIAPVEVGGGVVATLRARIAELEQERDEEQRQRKRANIAVVLAQEIIAENEVERERLREALREITKGEGAYSHDRFEHSCNTIDNMKAIARAAIEGRE